MKNATLLRLLILPAVTASATVCALLDGPSGPVPAPVPTVMTSTRAGDLDVDAELRDGCDRLISLATGDSADAAWAVAELQRATTAAWASEPLRAQARHGLDLVADHRLALASR